MKQSRPTPYGAWKSPITSDLIVSESIRLVEIALDGSDTYWIESRPAEQGRCVVVRRSVDGSTFDLAPAPFNARSRVHEYGGGAFAVADGTVFFSHFGDHRLYRQDPGGQPFAIAPEGSMRYADMIVDRHRDRLICVREDHSVEGREAINALVSLDVDGGGSARVVAEGNDFYSSPRISADGSRLAWLTWNHPNMPWDGTEVWVGDLQEDGSVGRATRVAGGVSESIFQPEWSPDGTLYFVSDRTGWWNLYRWNGTSVTPVCPMEAEFGAPQWVFGMSTYAFCSADLIICTYTQRGVWHLGSVNTASGEIKRIETPYTDIECVRASPEHAVFLAGSPTEVTSLVELDLSTEELSVLRRSSGVELDPAYLSLPRAIEFPTENGLTAHAFFYRPRNPEHVGPPGEKPPLLVVSHGGPTASASSELSLSVQYWTSRGFGVLDVNYGGSTGYGREYRQRLEYKWGIVDVDDCINGALFLADQGEVDSRRLVIRGGSAGGYTTLCALTFRDVFRAGASYYGIGDLEVVTEDSHKFESRYGDLMIGPYPEGRDIYRERSPINYVERLSCPVIFFQGLDDKVVPPNQAEMMVSALRKKGVPVAYLPFEGEQHGFRQAENIKRCLDAELYFYGKVLGFEPAGTIEPVRIENL